MRDDITMIRINMIIRKLLIIIFRITIFLKNSSIRGIYPNDIKTSFTWSNIIN